MSDADTEPWNSANIQPPKHRVHYVHNGFDGWSFGTPVDPQLITEETAEVLMAISGLTEREIRTVMPAAQYADAGDLLYEATGGNRFLVFGPIEDCRRVDPAKVTVPLEFTLP